MSKLFVASEVFHGAGSLSELKNLSGKKAIIVTGGQSMKKSGTLDRAKAFLTEAGLETIVFDGVEEDPSSATSLKGAEIMREFQPDWIVGLGGCSAIDAAKMMWVFYEHPDADFEAMTKPFSVPTLRQKAKFVAIPSTSGTGTETTGLAVITDKEKGVKYPIVSYELTPDIAIVDGEICATMPAHITSNTGLDALTHCVEAYVSNIEDNYADVLAKGGLEIVFDNLEEAVNNPTNIKARQNMHDASFMGGLAFNNAWLGIVHSLSHQVGALYGIPHGAANAIFLPNVIRYNQTETTRYPNLAKIVGKETAEELAQEIEKLRASVNNIGSLKAFGISREDWDKNLDYITKNALEDPCTGFNPRKPSLQDLKDLYNACYEGVIYQN
ncbi:iron-containing alcohol dehydrogenase [Flavobacterium sp. F-328]|jgi:alcohol dehydrogenase class IV|uniref:Iron-containing alcohol dehydrogenase n=3 Tax=Flavobacteriales TaxID=200644 RepID=A0A9Q3UXL9_9FLAO|nr:MULTISPECIES: iron-containing alcohol dehydrogenase [Flavobacteriales]MBD3904731.1 iron-containing alcohol dehydrogenase [Chryseobacterium muglaense]MBQ0907401.1 iron-containing alcohol dehydrogenase [Flavobacterium erciyesense]MCC9036237.1 iron-containing alcohol dehydrogenase [Chryseobacterium muglaense]MCC9070621.1 iron-containing alcohol dehydrogenase [Flavobacterium sp. F-65]MCM2554884.1 iron-containing alcohol dehydrogenase [Chryseobacterium muglaense]